jgi:hypothetical protein
MSSFAQAQSRFESLGQNNNSEALFIDTKTIRNEYRRQERKQELATIHCGRANGARWRENVATAARLLS